jgi:acetyl esterase/lipase
VDLADVAPALREQTRKAPKPNVANPLSRWLWATLSRLAPGVTVEGVERRIVHDDEVRVRVYLPAHRSGAGLLWIHGGGLVLGSAAADDRMCAETAMLTGAVIVSVDYRLAPKHPFPVPLDDCAAGFAWMLTHAAELGVDPDRIAVGGQSAGGGLAAALVQRLHDESVPVLAQWLFCPMLDDRTAMDRSRDAADHFVWNNRSNRAGWAAYLGDRLGAADMPPYAVPARRDDLRGLPTTWMYASDIELFYDEDREYARRLREAGVSVDFEVVAGAPHGFEAWASDSEPARALLQASRDWLRAALG